MLTFLAALPLSLFAERSRERWMRSNEPALRPATAVCGVVQCLVFFVLANIIRLQDLPLAVILYFSAGGLVRFVAAVATGEILPTAPLYLVSLLQSGHAAKRERESRPKLVPDVVEGSSSNLTIRSCAAKQWNQSTTIRYQDVLYEVAGEGQGDAFRPFCYRLRPIPEGKLIRGIRDYSPTDVLQEH